MGFLQRSATSSVFYLLLLLLQFFTPPAGSASAEVDEYLESHICGDSGNYTSGSVYEYNLKRLLASLSSANASLSGFKSDTVGREKERIEGLVLCRGDMSTSGCASCLRNANQQILELCPNSKSATIWYDYCLLDYNYQFITEAMQVMYNVVNQTDNYGFIKLFRDVAMDSIAYQAAYTLPKKFATAEVNFINVDTTIFGLAQCTPDLSGNECSRCLQNMNDMMPKWFDGKKGGRVLGIRCNMRYEEYLFFQGRPMLMFNSSDNALNLSTPTSPSNNASNLTTHAAPPRRSTSPKSISLIGAGVGAGALFLLIGGVVCFYWYMKRRQLIKLRTKFFKQNGGLLLQRQLSALGIDATTKTFTIEELRKASSNFSESQILGKGGFGTVYKGTLKDHRIVAIKKSMLLHEKQREQFINEIVILSQTSHRNVVKLMGCCLDTQVPLLVYEFIPNGNLFHRIHGDDLLRWEDRLRIATETAGALAYLHGATSPPVIHRDVKSTNILLDEHLTAKVSDFGASRAIPFDHTHLTTLVQGTRGYLDPEYCRTCQLTGKSDVYSFGVVLAELLTGEPPVCFERPEEPTNLAYHFASKFDENCLIEMIEREILEEAGEEQLLMVAEVARNCLNLKGEERPPMKEVATQIDGIRAKYSKKHATSAHQQNVEKMRFLVEDDRSASVRHSLVQDMCSSMDFPR